MMLSKCSRRHSAFLILSALIAMVALSGRGYAQSALLNHPVLAKYPSPEQLQERVDKFKSEHATEFADARADFDLALRSQLDLTPIHFPDERRPIRIKKWRRRSPVPCALLRESITELANTGESLQRRLFYEEHFDELCVEHSTAMRIVVLNVLLNGWDNWSEWNTARLTEYRKRYPDSYRFSSLSFLLGKHHQDRQQGDQSSPENPPEAGLLLRMLLDPEVSPSSQTL